MLETFLVSQVFAFFLIFCRIGSGIMVLPGYGEAYVPVPVRLALALIISLLLTPFLSKLMPPFPTSSFALGIMVITEIITGLFIGGISRILISCTHIAGMIFAFQSGLSSAVIFDVNQNTQGSLIGNFLGIVVAVLIFSLNLHHLMLRGITDSYLLFLPGHFPPVNDFVEVSARMVADTFDVAVKISAPYIVIGLLLYLGAGVISRLMPTIQVFFLIVPPQLMISFVIFIACFSAMLLWYMDFYKDKLLWFLSYVH